MYVDVVKCIFAKTARYNSHCDVKMSLLQNRTNKVKKQNCFLTKHLLNGLPNYEQRCAFKKGATSPLLPPVCNQIQVQY